MASGRISRSLGVPAALLVACVAAAAQPAVTSLVAFDAKAGELAESLTLDARGNWYFSMQNRVLQVTPEHHKSVFATLPITGLSAGLKVGRDGCVYAGSVSNSPGAPGSWIWRLCEGAQPEIYATLAPNGFPNDIAFDGKGNLFATDPRLGRIWKIAAKDRAVSVWKEDPLLGTDPAKGGRFGVDGIAFEARSRALWVNNLDEGRVLRIEVRRDGAAGVVENVVTDPRLVGSDGMAFDSKGLLYMVVNSQDRLVSISRKGEIDVLAEGAPLDGPSSLVFGTRRADRNVLYIANFAVDRARGRKPGDPHPALLSYPTSASGLPLAR